MWISGDALAPRQVESAIPIPFLVAASPSSAIGVTYQFSDEDPIGVYTLHSVVVRPGADSREPCEWIHTATFPFVATERVAPPLP